MGARIVLIPDRSVPAGHISSPGLVMRAVEVTWICPACGGPRGEVVPTRIYDGSKRLWSDGWTNPCGHIDKYADVLREAADY